MNLRIPLQNKERMLIFVGNSHLDALVNDIDRLVYTKIQLSGASVKGLVNPYSLLGLRERINESLSSNDDSLYVFLLGQVDIEFGYYYKCVKENTKLDFKKYVDEILSAYHKYLEIFPKRFIICSIYPSVIRNILHNFNVSFRDHYGMEGKYSEINHAILYDSDICKEIYVDSYNERVGKCRYFNTKLKEMCKTYKYRYIDLWDELMISEYEVNPKYVPVGECEHHLATNIPSEIVLKKFQDVLEDHE